MNCVQQMRMNLKMRVSSGKKQKVSYKARDCSERLAVSKKSVQNGLNYNMGGPNWSCDPADERVDLCVGVLVSG